MAGRLSQNSRLKPVHPLVTIRAAAASGPSGNSLKASTSPRAANRVLRGARFDFRCWMTASAVSGLSTVSRSSLGVGSRACALPSEGWFLSVSSFLFFFLIALRSICETDAFASALPLISLDFSFQREFADFREVSDFCSRYSISRCTRPFQSLPSTTTIFSELTSSSSAELKAWSDRPQRRAICFSLRTIGAPWSYMSAKRVM